jgi:hypothetical protein
LTSQRSQDWRPGIWRSLGGGHADIVFLAQLQKMAISPLDRIAQDVEIASVRAELLNVFAAQLGQQCVLGREIKGKPFRGTVVDHDVLPVPPVTGFLEIDGHQVLALGSTSQVAAELDIAGVSDQVLEAYVGLRTPMARCPSTHPGQPDMVEVVDLFDADIADVPAAVAQFVEQSGGGCPLGADADDVWHGCSPLRPLCRRLDLQSFSAALILAIASSTLARLLKAERRK